MKKVLIADDSGTARMFLRKCLEIAGFQGATFSEVPNGREGMAALSSGDFDLVVTDLNMPVMDGADLLRGIKASPIRNQIPVIVVTSVQNEAKTQELQRLGAFAVLSKPITPALFATVLKPLISMNKEPS